MLPIINWTKILLFTEHLHHNIGLPHVQKHRILHSQRRVMIHVWQCMSQAELNGIETTYWRKKATDVCRMRCDLCCKIVAFSNCPYYPPPQIIFYSRLQPAYKQHLESQKDKTAANFSTVLCFDKWAIRICLLNKASSYVHTFFITSTASGPG